MRGSNRWMREVSSQNSASDRSRTRLIELIDTTSWVRIASLSSSAASAASCAVTSGGASNGM